MSLQRRLALFFVLIVILPLAVAGFIVQRVVVDEISRRASLSLSPAVDATLALYRDRTEALDARVRGTLGLSQLAEVLRDRDAVGVRGFLSSRLSETSNLDFFIAYDEKGERLAFERTRGDFLAGFELPAAEEIEEARGSGVGFVSTQRIPVRIEGEGRVGSILGGSWIDQDLLAGSSQEGVNLSLVGDGQIIASTALLGQTRPLTPNFGDIFRTDIDGEADARAARLPGDMAVVSSTPTSPIDALSQRVLTSLAALLALAVLGTGALAYLLARLITQPIEELSAGAQAIAQGRFDHRIHTRSRDEVGKLAQAFNEMSERLSATIGELSEERDRLQRVIHRVGETLRSTHDMNQILGSIINTAVDAANADVGVFWRFNSNRSELYPASLSNITESQVDRVAIGEGVVGHVAERASDVLVPGPSGVGPRPASGEPSAPIAMAVPVYSQDRVAGVLAVYRTDPSRPYAKDDLNKVIFLAEQGGVAIENVMLHEEARRLSLMDGLTGIWNRRFIQMQFRQTLATAQRFQRPFSILMMDLDRFKAINDVHGHPRGDSVLVEFAKRVSGALREVDTFARYGGEEFVVLLPETDVAGAVATAEKICEVTRSKQFGDLDEEPVSISVSIGISVYPANGDTLKKLIEAADIALYKAKEDGRDRVVVAEPGPGKLRLA